jgi:hypothetical protein
MTTDADVKRLSLMLMLIGLDKMSNSDNAMMAKSFEEESFFAAIQLLCAVGHALPRRKKLAGFLQRRVVHDYVTQEEEKPRLLIDTTSTRQRHGTGRQILHASFAR